MLFIAVSTACNLSRPKAEIEAVLVALLQVSFYRRNLFLKILPKAKGQNEEGNDIQLEAMIDYIW